MGELHYLRRLTVVGLDERPILPRLFDKFGGQVWEVVLSEALPLPAVHRLSQGAMHRLSCLLSSERLLCCPQKI